MSEKANTPVVSFGALLRRHRGDLGLTQEELAERAGIHAQEVSKLERDVVRRPRSTTVQFLAEALTLDAQQREAFAAAARGEPASAALSQIEESMAARASPANLMDAESLLASMPTDVLPPRGPLPAGSRMPLAPNPLFVGRGDELFDIAAALGGSGATVALGQVVASTGLGGLGKTQLAVEFIHRYGPFFAGGVFWLTFASARELPLQVAACAAPEFESRSLEERVKLVKDAWQSAMPQLLVFDNCEDEALLEAWRPTSGGCRVLVTSRRSHWSPTLGVRALPLDLLPRADSIELIRGYRPDLASEDPGLHAIAAELGDLPLALHLAGSYLHAYGAEVSLDGYLAELRRAEVVQHASLLGAGLDDSPSPTHHVPSVAQTFALCLGRLDREREVDRVAIALLGRMACMAPGAPVPRELLANTLVEVDPLLRADGLRRLGAVGLVEEGEGWLRLHRLLAHFLRLEHLDPKARTAVDRALVACGDEARRGKLAVIDLTAAIPHLMEAAGSAREDADEMRLARLCSATGLALQYAGDLREARPWLERALDIRQRAPERDSIVKAESCNDLGTLLWECGELDAARPLHERALAIRETVLGSDHPDVAASLNELALLLWAQGELARARDAIEHSLFIRERVLGPDHRDTAESVHNLAILLRAQGDLEAARERCKRAVSIRERALGPGHPETAMSLCYLALVLRDFRELAAARPLAERALSILQCVHGPDHPRTAWSMHSLAAILLDQGDVVAARPLFERALAVREAVLGPDHPDTAFSLNGLGRVRHAQGELEAARLLFQRALAVRQRTLGPDHPDTARSLRDLALLLRDQGDPTAARPLFDRALAIRERVLGPDHPDTVATRTALAEEGGGPTAGDA